MAGGEPGKDGNLRDHATAAPLVCLANLESLNAEYIRQGLPQAERLVRLNVVAIVQMQSLLNNQDIKRLEG